MRIKIAFLLCLGIVLNASVKAQGLLELPYILDEEALELGRLKIKKLNNPELYREWLEAKEKNDMEFYSKNAQEANDSEPAKLKKGSYFIMNENSATSFEIDKEGKVEGLGRHSIDNRGFYFFNNGIVESFWIKNKTDSIAGRVYNGVVHRQTYKNGILTESDAIRLEDQHEYWRNTYQSDGSVKDHWESEYYKTQGYGNEGRVEDIIEGVPEKLQ